MTFPCLTLSTTLTESESQCRRNTPLFISFQGRPVVVLGHGVRWKSDGSPMEVRHSYSTRKILTLWASALWNYRLL